MHVSKLHAALLDAGIPIPGPWTEANVIVRLTRSEGRFIRNRPRHVWSSSVRAARSETY